MTSRGSAVQVRGVFTCLHWFCKYNNTCKLFVHTSIWAANSEKYEIIWTNWHNVILHIFEDGKDGVNVWGPQLLTRWRDCTFLKSVLYMSSCSENHNSSTTEIWKLIDWGHKRTPSSCLPGTSQVTLGTHGEWRKAACSDLPCTLYVNLWQPHFSLSTVKSVKNLFVFLLLPYKCVLFTCFLLDIIWYVYGWDRVHGSCSLKEWKSPIWLVI